jgi:hypothetical protein
MTTLQDLEKEIEIIKQRNKKVEADKAWETSFTRKIIIAILTYITVVLFFVFAGLANPFINAIVPSLAFVFSTMTLPFIKKIWLKTRK